MTRRELERACELVRVAAEACLSIGKGKGGYLMQAEDFHNMLACSRALRAGLEACERYENTSSGGEYGQGKEHAAEAIKDAMLDAAGEGGDG